VKHLKWSLHKYYYHMTFRIVTHTVALEVTLSKHW